MLEARKEAVHNLGKAYDLLHYVYVSVNTNPDLSNDPPSLKNSIEQLIDQIKAHISEIGLADQIDLNDSQGNLDWNKVNKYIGNL
ncbi:hypothetical protein [Nostoc sp.]|uniref:hypothetical protein n=1 Tax=Nostoc sp. TaxID=1180 RepID=UPI002FF6A6BD